MIGYTYTVASVQFGTQGWGREAYGHEPLECARVRPVVYSEALESVIVPQVVKAEGGELNKGDIRKSGRFRSEQGHTSTQLTDHIPKTAGERWVIAVKSSELLRKGVQGRVVVIK